MKDLEPNQLKFVSKLPLITKNAIELRLNQYSGVQCILEPLAVSLFDFIIEAQGEGAVDSYGQYKTVLYNNVHVAMRDWHKARMLFRELWPDEYMDLID